jgi:type I restriction enzyme S subunit
MVGIGVFPHADMPSVAFPDTMIACTADRDLIEPEYLQSLWSSAHVRNQIEAGARTTNGTYKVNQTLLGNVEFPLAPIALQKRFSRVVRSIRSKSKSDDFANNEAEDLFASLQQRAFRGEL